MFKNKTVVLGVTGSIAAYKTAGLASSLVKRGCRVQVIMSENSKNFINPITFEELTKNRCITDTFDRNYQYNVAHISLAQQADVFMVAPATANIIGKIAGGIADDMLSTTLMAAKCPVIIAPAMNTNMYENPIVQDNIKKLRDYGCTVVEPEEGELACGTSGKGRLPGESVLLAYIEKALSDKNDLAGKRVLVTAGPTREAIDPVRYITNHSSGKMGYAMAQAAALRGALVTLVSGPVSLEPPPFVKTVSVISARDMFREVTARAGENDIIIKAAAVADFTPVKTEENKIKKSGAELTLQTKKTKDILEYLGKNKRENQLICGFSMETENLEESSRKKLLSKNLDLIVCNNLKEQGAGFGVDTNRVTVIDKNGATPLELMSKRETADKILDIIIKMI